MLKKMILLLFFAVHVDSVGQRIARVSHNKRDGHSTVGGNQR